MYARHRPAPFYAFAHVDPTRTEGWERYRRRRVIFATLVIGKVSKKSAHGKTMTNAGALRWLLLLFVPSCFLWVLHAPK